MALCLSKCVVCSIVHWYWYEHNSIAHWMDRYCATCVIAYALFLDCSVRQICLFFCAVTLFVCGRRTQHEIVKRNLHLCFRYFAFWMCMCVAVEPNFALICLLTISYALVIIITKSLAEQRQ